MAEVRQFVAEITSTRAKITASEAIPYDPIHVLIFTTFKCPTRTSLGRLFRPFARPVPLLYELRPSHVRDV